MSVVVRAARAEDAAIIAAYDTALALESEGKRLDPARLAPGVTALLADAAKGRFFMAELAGRAVGQTMITHEGATGATACSGGSRACSWRPKRAAAGCSARSTAISSTPRAATRRPAASASRVENANARARRIYLGLGLRPGGCEVLELDFRAPASELELPAS